MADFSDLSSSTPLAPVATDALIRMWRFVEPQWPTGTPPIPVAYDINLVQDQVGAADDAVSVFFRTALLRSLFQLGVLDEWRRGDDLPPFLFDVAAKFPLDGGVEAFDLAAFLNEVRARAIS